jgi:hypothetical protein
LFQNARNVEGKSAIPGAPLRAETRPVKDFDFTNPATLPFHARSSPKDILPRELPVKD